MSLAVVIIAHDKRLAKLEEVYRSAIWQHPDEVVICADSPQAWPMMGGHRWVQVPPATRTTLDALTKRDVGYLTTTSDNVCFLADDHLLGDQFVSTFRETYEPRNDWDVLVPSRVCWVPGDQPGTPAPDQSGREQEVWLNVGQHHLYAGGHCSVYKRKCAWMHPFSATARHRLWDALHSIELVGKGARLKYADRDLVVIDNEPEAAPWL